MEQNTNQAPVCKNQEMQQYFNTLPQFVQETLILSGPEMNTLQELKCCAENLMKKQGRRPETSWQSQTIRDPRIVWLCFFGPVQEGRAVLGLFLS